MNINLVGGKFIQSFVNAKLISWDSGTRVSGT